MLYIFPLTKTLHYQIIILLLSWQSSSTHLYSWIERDGTDDQDANHHLSSQFLIIY